MLKSHKAILSLLLLSPGIAELLSSSSPPTEFFNPFSFIYLVSFYGSGALLIREFRVRHGLRYSSILFLGMGYGVLEEGIAVKSFFSTTWPDLGVLAWYGRFLGVNWIWVFALTVYHAVISILIPIVIVEIIFYDIKDRPWLKDKKSLYIILFIFIFDIILFNTVFVSGFQPSIFHYLFCFSLVAIFSILSTQVDIKPLNISGGCLKLWLIGFAWMIFFYFIYFGLPHLDVPFQLVIILGVIHTYIGFRYLMIVDRQYIAPNIKMATVLGPPSFFMFLAPFTEINPNRSDNPAGMTLVSIVFAIIFYILYRKSKILSIEIQS